MNTPLKVDGSRHSTRGFTLVESLVVLIIVGVLGSTTAVVLVESMRVYARAVPTIDAAYRSNLALARLKIDIRSLPSPTAVTRLDATEFAFVNDAGEAVTYRFAATALTRNGDALADGLSSFSITYRGSDGNPTSQASELRLVEIDLVANVHSDSYPLHASIAPRTFGP